MTRKKLGLALGCGGWRGLVHVGVLKSLEEHGIKIDVICGSSTGAMIGGLYATTMSALKTEEVMRSIKYKDLFKVMWDVKLRKSNGVIKGNKVDEFFRSFVGDKKIEDLQIKFGAVCTDLYKAETVVIKKGDLVTAIRASSAIPVVFQPVEIKGKLLVDGGATEPVPVAECRKMGADIVIGVSLYGGVFPITDRKMKNQIDVAKVSRFMPLRALARCNLKEADVALEPKIWGEDYGLLANFVKNKEAIDCGKKAMDRKIEEIRQKLR